MIRAMAELDESVFESHAAEQLVGACRCGACSRHRIRSAFIERPRLRERVRRRRRARHFFVQ